MAYLTGARAAVVAFLETALPDLQVWAGPRFPDQLLADCLVVAPTAVQPPSVASPGVVASLDLFVLCANTSSDPSQPDASETALEALLDSVLVALDANLVTWTRAERSTFQEKYPAYKIEMEIPR